MSYFLEVFDNDAVSGPKSARTPVMTARFPTMAELYAGMEAEHSEEVVELKDILRFHFANKHINIFLAKLNDINLY